MNSTTSENRSADSTRPLRRLVYVLLIAIAVGWCLARIAAVSSVEMVALQKERLRKIPEEVAKLQKKLESEQIPVLRVDGTTEVAVDGSTVTRPYTQDEIDEKLARKTTELTQKYEVLTRPFLSGNDRSRWCTARALVEPELRVEGAPYAIDKVIQQPGWDTIDMVKHDGHLYSSKPPLFPTVLAGAYWCVVQTTGWTLATHPFAVGRVLLVFFNLVPFVLYFLVMIAMIERLAKSDFTKIFTVAVMVMGTLLSTFIVVINNHLPAAVTVAITLYALIRIRFDDDSRYRWYFLAGLAAALVASFELPGSALLAGTILVLLVRSPKRTVVAALPAILLVVVPYFATNIVAHDSLRLPYMHRSKTVASDNWYSYTYERNGRTLESYWDHPQGKDLGEPSRAKYSIHCLVGHHGVFSLTPVWILSVIGLLIWLIRGGEWNNSENSEFEKKNKSGQFRLLSLAIFALTLLILGFYLGNRPQIDRNYGGMTCGLRWTFWLSPLWLVGMVPALDAISGSGRFAKWVRWVAVAGMVISVFSVVWPYNPWTDPWLEEFFVAWPTLW